MNHCRALNHIKLYRPYSSNTNVLMLSGKRLYSDMYSGHNYKKHKINNRSQVESSYTNSDNNTQLKYDIGVIKKKLDGRLVHKSDGYRRDGLIFEKVLGIIYENAGYVITQTGGSNDGGVDLIAEKDNKKIAIQAKNYNDKMTGQYLNKGNIETVFDKIKNGGESRHLVGNESFYSARLHIYNDNIVSMRPCFIENIAIKHGYDIFDKAVYGKTWLLNYTNYLTPDSIDKFYELLDGD